MFNLPLGQWLEINCQKDINFNFMGIPWKILFDMGVWRLWLHKNNFIFKTGKVEHLSFKRCIKDSAEYYSIGINAKLQKTKAIIPVGWTRLLEGWAKLNSDGSALGNPRRAREGGVFQNHDGEWIKGYARPLDTPAAAGQSFELKGWLDIG